MKQNLIFISDIHLGAGATNNFYHTYTLHRLFDYAAENANELIIVGDFLELLQSDFYKIYSEHHNIFQHLFRLAKKIEVKYVFGNHDSIVGMDYDPQKKRLFLGSDIEILPQYDNLELKIFATHGHQFSLLNNRNDCLGFSEKPVGDRTVHVANWTEKNIHPKLNNFIKKIYLNFKKWQRQISRRKPNFAGLVNPTHPDYIELGGDFSEYSRGAHNVLQNDHYSLTIFGHTHFAEIKKFEEGIYANCGSFVNNYFADQPPTFLEVNEDFVRLVDATTFELIENIARPKKISQKKEKRGVLAKTHFSISKKRTSNSIF